jgi:hypothetical protein
MTADPSYPVIANVFLNLLKFGFFSCLRYYGIVIIGSSGKS